MLQYKGYTGKVEFDDSIGILHGTVIGIRDVVTFEGNTVEEIVQAFHDSVDDYLEFCEKRGEDPDRPYSGQLRIRMAPELHRWAAMLAERDGISLNEWVSRSISNQVERETNKELT